MWSLAIENNPAISDYCEKYSTANGDKKTGYLAFTRENWLRVLLQHKEIIKTAVKYKALKLFNPGDWRTLLCEDFDFSIRLRKNTALCKNFTRRIGICSLGILYKKIFPYTRHILSHYSRNVFQFLTNKIIPCLNKTITTLLPGNGNYCGLYPRGSRGLHHWN